MTLRISSAAICQHVRNYLTCECLEYVPPPKDEDEDEILKKVKRVRKLEIQEVRLTMRNARVGVEKNDRGLQVALKVLSQLVKLRCRLYSVVERWRQMDAERLVEDHEYLLLVRRETRKYAKRTCQTFDYAVKREVARFEVVHNPEEYFSADTLLPVDLDPDTKLPSEELLDKICRTGFCPMVKTWALRYNEGETELRRQWTLVHIGIAQRTVYYAAEFQHLYAFLIALRLTGKDGLGRNNFGVVRYAHLTNLTIYTIPDASAFPLPEDYEACFCLRPRKDNGQLKPLVLAMRMEKKRDYFVAMLRLAKYGKRLVDDYVAMRRPIKKEEVTYDAFDPCDPAVSLDSTPGRQLKYDWMHPSCRFDKKTRGWAEAYLEAQGGEDGLFLVRDLHTDVPLHYVLSYCYRGSVYHAPIIPKFDTTIEKFVFSLEKDRSVQFFDIVQLVEYYLLNIGSLKTKLTKPA